MILSILHAAFVLLMVIVLFNAVIVVHELGHFLAARWRGLYVEEFGVWFGKPIWKRTYNGVVYSLGSIPAGGFVKLPQLAPMEALEGETRADLSKLPAISPLDKIIVAFAGPLFSMGLAVLLACVVWFVGKPVYEAESTTVIGYVEKGSPAEKAGLQPGDRILKVDGHPVTRFNALSDSVTWYVVRSEGPTIPFLIERDGKELLIETGFTIPTTKWFQRKGLRQVGLAPAFLPKIAEVEPGSPAEKAGLRAGDIITHYNGVPLYFPPTLSELIASTKGKEPVAITFQRGNEWFNETIVPTVLGPNELPRIGIRWSQGEKVMIHPSPLRQIEDSVGTIFNMVGALFSKSDVKAQHFSGPIGIGKLYYNLFMSEDGWRLVLWFSVFFNVNLAVLNMLPLPVLDGGHITLAILEAIRRKPVNIKVLEFVQSACALALISFMLYVTFYDVVDLSGRGQSAKETPPPEAKPAASASE